MPNTYKIYHSTPISNVLKREFMESRQRYTWGLTFGGWLQLKFGGDVKIVSTSTQWLHDYSLTFKDYKQKLLFEIKYGEYL